jgi:DNA (cytosine-5)-methyltransferase 1
MTFPHPERARACAQASSSSTRPALRGRPLFASCHRKERRDAGCSKCLVYSRASAAFDLGLERTGGFKTTAFCEIDPFCRRVLAKHWPEVPCYHDVRDLTADRLRADGISVDVICGGFPCQDISIAGKGAGLAGERSGLWSEIVRLSRELRPRFVLVENVTGLLSGPIERPGGWFGRVLGDLAGIGYDAEWENIPASALGAPHRRERVWITAYPNEVGRGRAPFGLPPLRQFVGGIEAPAWLSVAPEPVVFGVDDGVPDGLDQRAAYGNTLVPQIPELIGRAILAAEIAA